MEFMPNRGMPLGNLSDIAPERFGDDAKVAFDLFHLLGIHGTPCIDRSLSKCNGDRANDRGNGGFWKDTALLLLTIADSERAEQLIAMPDFKYPRVASSPKLIAVS